MNNFYKKSRDDSKQNLLFSLDKEIIQCNEQKAKSKIAKWLTKTTSAHNIKWRYFVTLTFKNEIKSYCEAKNITTKFYKKLNNAVFGKRSKKGLRCLFFIEQSYFHGYHVHIMFEDFFERLKTEDQIRRSGCEESFKSIIKNQWNGVDRRTGNPDFKNPSTSFQEIRCEERLWSYLTKQIKSVGSEVFAFDLMNVDGRKLNSI